jgi:chromosome segregation ATPase
VENLSQLAEQWGPWAGVALALAVALRSRAETERLRAQTSDTAVEQVRRWLGDLRGRVQSLEAEAAECERRGDECEGRNEKLAKRVGQLEQLVEAQGQTIARYETLLAAAADEREELQRVIETGEPSTRHNGGRSHARKDG